MDVIKNEYPALKVTTYVPRNTIENLAVNLYSDKYFVPFRGKSFLHLSEKARTKDWRKIQSCYIKNSYQNVSYKAWVFNNIIYNYQIDFRSDVFSNKIVARNQLRDALGNELKQLSNGTKDYDGIQRLKTDLKLRYAVLFPSEIENALSLVNNYESIAADKMLLKRVTSLQDLKKTKASLEKLLNFESVNRELYSKASEQIRSQVNLDIKSKTKDLVDYLMPKEVLKLAGTKSTDANAQKINRLIADFKKDYSPVLHIESAQQTLQLFRKRKTQIISNMTSYLSAGIESTKSKDDLDTLDKLILSDLDQSSSTYTELADKIKKQRQFIINEQNRIAQEKRMKAGEAQRLFTEEANIRAIKVAKLQKEVNVLRQKLNLKYSNSLPSYEDLHYLLQAYMVMVSPSKKYSDSDANNFIRKARELGFERIGSGKMSNNMLFKNRFGHFLNVYGNFEKSSGWLSFKIKEVTEEVKSYYIKDILANYRNRFESFKTPDEEKIESSAYVNSGRTLYKYIIVNNILAVEAVSNYKSEVDIEAELIAPKKYKLTPFSTMTNIFLRKGDKLNLQASGTMKVGSFLGNSGPEGVKALSIYNIDKRFLHGSIIGKIGKDGEWFLVGKGGTFTTNSKGRLYLRVNDRLVNDNEGFYTVNYEVN